MTEIHANSALNGICPYFTMFPLDFPYAVLKGHAALGEWVLDPFCGRGTTNFASRMLGLPSIGIDSSPVASALSRAKLANTLPAAIVRAASRILEEIPVPHDVPQSEFWDWAYHPDVLNVICRLRDGLNQDCRSDARQALRAVMLGALHGPLNKIELSHFSNQSPRTYAPKPRYAIEFWKKNGLRPPQVDVLRIIGTRAERYYSRSMPAVEGAIIAGDSREEATFRRARIHGGIRWVITSPPYYGMRTYLPDQWLRLWFVGGLSTVTYSNDRQLAHSSPGVYSSDLRRVWQHAARVAAPGAKLVVRFGGINDRNVEPLVLLKQSFQDSGWQIRTIKTAGSATGGRRQASSFLRSAGQALEEFDVWAARQG